MKDKKGWYVTIAALLLICLYPCLFEYINNCPESRVLDAMLFYGIFLLCSALIFAVCLLIFRKIWRAGFVSCLLTLILTNIGMMISAVQKVCPWVRGIYIMGILCLIVVLISILIVRKNITCMIPAVFLLLMFGVLNLTSIGMGIPSIIQTVKGNRAITAYETAAAQEQTALEAGAQPNVYYFIFDEYSGPQGLKHYYGYDNSSFYQELEQRGFTCSSDSVSPQGFQTIENVPDLYNLDYVTPSYFNSNDGEMPVLYQLFSEMGYQINLISHLNFLDTDGASVLSEKQGGESIGMYIYSDSLLPNTPLSRWIEKLPQLRYYYDYNAGLENVINLMETAYAYTDTDRPTLTLGYVQLPHENFVYNSDGSLLDEKYAHDWDDPQYYLGQLEYTNQVILKSVDAIQEHDPNAVIILQSDHGVRHAKHMREKHGTEYDHSVEDRFQEDILNCVYAGGQKLDLAGKSGVNTMRYMMNTLYDTDYSMLSDPKPADDKKNDKKNDKKDDRKDSGS